MSDNASRLVTGQRRYGGWLLATWIALIVAVAVEFVLGFLVTGLLMFLYGGVCFEPASPDDMREGRRVLIAVTAAGTAPWLLALVWTRHRLRVAVSGLVAVSPALLATLVALTASPAQWSSDWCLF